MEYGCWNGNKEELCESFKNMGEWNAIFVWVADKISLNKDLGKKNRF